MTDLQTLKDIVIDALEDIKAKDIVTLDVKPLTSVADLMIVASGTSNRHVKSIADNVREKVKHNGLQPLGVEGEEAAEWVLAVAGRESGTDRQAGRIRKGICREQEGWRDVEGAEAR